MHHFKPLAAFLMLLPLSVYAQRAKKGPKKPRPPAIVWVNPQPQSIDALPTGTQHLRFRSSLVDRDIGYCIYLPEAYHQFPKKRFPVIYNLHGNGGNEWTGLDSIKVLHEGIENGRWPPVIMVLPNGGHSTFYMDSADGQFPIESIFLNELIPHIDRKYRTNASGTARCIEGFSMGGRGATRLAIKHPSLFCSLFCQAGNVPNLIERLKVGEASEFPISYMGSDPSVYEANDVYLLLEKNRDSIRSGLRIQVACGTADGGHLPTVRDFHNALLEAKIDHTYIELEGLAHNRRQMIALLRPIWFDYHMESLRRSGAIPR